MKQYGTLHSYWISCCRSEVGPDFTFEWDCSIERGLATDL